VTTKTRRNTSPAIIWGRNLLEEDLTEKYTTHKLAGGGKGLQNQNNLYAAVSCPCRVGGRGTGTEIQKKKKQGAGLWRRPGGIWLEVQEKGNVEVTSVNKHGPVSGRVIPSKDRLNKTKKQRDQTKKEEREGFLLGIFGSTEDRG